MILTYDPDLGHRTGSYAAKEVAYASTAVRMAAKIDFYTTREDCFASNHPVLALAEFCRRQRLEEES